MAQNYPDIPSTETLQNSRQKLLDRDDALASCFSGTTFPTGLVSIGMLCLRTDETKRFQNDRLFEWWETFFEVSGIDVDFD